jgi:hypothetical protein
MILDRKALLEPDIKLTRAFLIICLALKKATCGSVSPIFSILKETWNSTMIPVFAESVLKLPIGVET